MGTDFERLIKEHEKAVYHCAFFYCGNRADAEDIMQEVFLYYYVKQPVLKDSQHERAWLLRVTINKSKNHLKSYWNRNTGALSEELKDEWAAESTDAVETWEMVNRLRKNYRTVIYLYYMEGYSVSEIAVILKRKDATVRTWLARARKELKEMLE